MVVPDHGCGREVLGRVVDVGVCGWKVSRRMLLGLLLGVSSGGVPEGVGV